MTATTAHIYKKEKLVPALRFQVFEGEWDIKRVDQVLRRYSKPVKVQSETKYQQIGIRSHGKGIFHKELVTGSSLGNKRVFWIKKNLFVVNIVFAWEHAVGMTTEAENGMIASHRFPMYESIGNVVDTEFITRFFLRKRGKYLLQLASPGGAGRNKTLGQQTFNELKITFPSLPEQQKISSFLGAVDDKIRQLTRKKELLVQYKKGVMQKLFSQGLRFNDEKGNPYPDWEENTLDEVAKFRRGSFPQPYGLPEWYDDNGAPFVQVYDVAENMHLKKDTKQHISEAAQKQSVFVKQGTLVLTIQGSIGRMAKTQYDAYVDRTLLIFQSYKVDIDIDYFKYVVYILFEIEKLKAPGGTIKTITKEQLSSFLVKLPCIQEQQKIADYLSAIDTKIESVDNQISQTQTFKKGLLQQMFI